MRRSINTYQIGFLFFLAGLGGWIVQWFPTAALAAPQNLSLSHFTDVKAWTPQGRRFTFEPGGAIRLAPRSLKPSERYDYYAALCAHLGKDPTRTTVLGLRGLGPNGKRHESGDNMSNYDDTFVVIRPSVREAREFLGATHAGQAVSSLSPKGVAQIQPGIYWAEPIGDFNGMPAWWVNTGWGDGQLPCFRDKNGDGFIAGKEREKTMIATEILFHNGRNDDYGTSIGCQVLPPAAMRNFIATIGEAEVFDYVLADANRPLGRRIY